MYDQHVWSKFNNPYAQQAIENVQPPKPPRKDLTSVETAAGGKKRPVVPDRPAHTMSIYSVDIRPGEKTAPIPPPKPTRNMMWKCFIFSPVF